MLCILLHYESVKKQNETQLLQFGERGGDEAPD